MDYTYTDILDFWFLDSQKWYNGWDDFDGEIEERFWKVYEDAIAWNLDHWIENPVSCLALIIVLDQFSRNMFRWNPRSFEYDFKALYITKIALKKGYLEELEWMQKHFLLMPLMHSESLPDQEFSVHMFREISTDKIDNAYALEHRDIIRDYGRFPHRNEVLARESTPEEKEFMKHHSGF